MANYMKEVAGLLGVELGESFKVVDDDSGKYHNYYRLTEKKGIEESNDNTNWESAIPGILKWILMGEIRIIKLPWKPSYGDVFYMPSVINENKYIRLFWNDSRTYKSFYPQGMVCRTKEEAIKLAEEMLDVARKRFAGDR